MGKENKLMESRRPSARSGGDPYKSMLEFDVYYGTHCLYCANFSLENNTCHYLAHLKSLFRKSPNGVDCLRYRSRS